MSTDSPSYFLGAERADALAAWRCSEPEVVSVHLTLEEDGGHRSALDRVIKDAVDADPAVAKVEKDLKRVAEFVRDGFDAGPRRGLAIFSCAKYGVFEAFAAPEPFTPSLRVAERPYLRPLSVLRARYYRFLSLQLDERAARFTEIHLGESAPLETSNGRFRAGDSVALAERAAYLFRARRANRFVLGAEPDLLAALEPVLSPELRDALIHEPRLGPDAPASAVVSRVRDSEREALKLREEVLVARFLDEVRGGAAVAGLERVADALQQGAVRRVLVRDGWTKMGRCCAACGRLSVDHRSCPWCFRTTSPVLDLVAELCDRAVAAGIEVFRVSDDARFESVGRIGAEIASPERYRPAAAPVGLALRARFALKDGRASPLRARFA
jgi:hypothetical protein